MTQVIDRIGAIIGTFTPERRELALPDFVEATGLNKSSIYRLLVSLDRVGLVERLDGAWRLGPAVVTLAAIRLGGIDLRGEAMPCLRELRREFNSAVAFSIPEGSEMVYVERLDSPDAFGVSARLGGRAPLWSGGSGKAVLACMTAEERERRLDTDRWRQLSADARRRVLRSISRAERHGYCTDDGEFFFGVGGVAVAIREGSRGPIAAMSVIVTADRLTESFVAAAARRLIYYRDQLEPTVAGMSGLTGVRDSRPQAGSPTVGKEPAAASTASRR